MTIQHEDIADPKIHEPKGVSTASQYTVYVADGAGSGSWIVPTINSTPYAAILAALQADLDDGDLDVTGRLFITTVIPDVSTADSVIIPLIDSCTVIGASVVLEGAITVADASVSFKNSAGASMGTPVTVAYDGSAKGDQYAFTATGNNVITGPSWIEVETDGGSTDPQRLFVTVEVEQLINVP